MSTDNLNGTLSSTGNLNGTFGTSGGGTSNYNDLANKPQINGNTLEGNKTPAQLGINIPDMTNYYNKSETNTLLNGKANVSDLPDMTNYYNKSETDNLLDGKVDNIDFNAASLPITSGSATNTKSYIDSGLSGKQNTISDSGWLPLPLASGVSNYGDLVSNYRKIGNIVYYNLWVEKSGLSWGSQVATMPSGYRPIGESTSSGRYGNGICNFSIATNGIINFLATTNTSSSDYRMFASGCFAI